MHHAPRTNGIWKRAPTPSARYRARFDARAVPTPAGALAVHDCTAVLVPRAVEEKAEVLLTAPSDAHRDAAALLLAQHFQPPRPAPPGDHGRREGSVSHRTVADTVTDIN